jgi:hypothetical protein
VGNNKSYGVTYNPTMPKSMNVLFTHIGAIDSATTYIDLGSGKGLTLLVASRLPFKKITGVEFSLKLHRLAQENIKRYRGRKRCANIESLCMDAADFQFPAGPLLIYFFNPFAKPVMERVLANLASSVLDNPRPVKIICDRLHDHDLFSQYLHPRKIEAVAGFSIYSELRPVATEIYNA